jgi:NADH-quinone oxidoreductase subunit A
MLIVSALIGLISMLIGVLVRPKKPDRVKYSVYECGMPEFGDARRRYNVRFYVIAMLFVIFDVETVFLFPWAVAFDMLGIFGLIEMILFIVILVFGYFYAWKKGALEWA